MRSAGFVLGLALTASAADVSPFEQLIAKTDYDCNHRVARSTCSDAQYRGLVVFFHGFSACSSQVSNVAARMTAQCYDVLAPTSPGHGRKPITDCDAPGVTCTIRWNAKQGFDLRELPTKPEAYASYVDTINTVVAQELEFRARATGKAAKDLKVSAMGLSFGAALAVYAVSNGNGLYSHQLLLNPSFGGGKEEVDQDLLDCQDAVRKGQKPAQACTDVAVASWTRELGGGPATFLLQYMVPQRDSSGQFERALSTRLHLLSQYWVGAPNSKSVQTGLRMLLEKPVIWNDVCAQIFSVASPRSGFCMFNTKHLMGTNSFSLNTLVGAVHQYEGGKYKSFPITQFIVTERDGETRNGLAYQLASQMFIHNQVPKGSACMYRFEAGTNRRAQWYDDSKSLPHAPIDKAPGVWWESSLFGRIVGFLTGDDTVSGSEVWNGGRDECVSMPLAADGMTRQPWLSEALLPSAAPLTPEELVPDAYWTNDVLQFDNRARVMCKDPTMKPLIAGFVDCTIFGSELSDLVVV